MARKRRSRKAKRPPTGSSPGTLVADPTLPPPKFRLIAYGPDRMEERQLGSPAELKAVLEGRQWPVTWLDVDGLGDAEAIKAVGEAAGLHRLSVADVVHPYQRPKVEDFGTYLFIVVRMPGPGCAPGEGGAIETEQVSLCLGDGFVLTFQERAKPGDCFGGVRERIRNSIGAIRGRGADYLAYALLDAAVDAYFPLLEDLGERLEAMEEDSSAAFDVQRMRRLHAIRRDYLTIRRAAWPLREAVGALQRDQSRLISDHTRLYLRDCYDHTVQVIDLVETGRELGAALMEMHLAGASHRMNEIVKVLTIITTIFIPLSFIAGIYGMNFDTRHPANMPELRWAYGYPAVLTAMAVIAAIMVAVFWRRGWIGRR